MDHNSTNQLVVNLSKLKLSNDHVSLLSKELNFRPTPYMYESDPSQNRDDMDSFHKRLKFYYHFRSDVEDPKSDPPSFLEQTNWFSTNPF